MLTSTAGEASSATAKAAPVASARMFSAETVSVEPAHAAAAFLSAAARKCPKLKIFPIIAVVSFGRSFSARRPLQVQRSRKIRASTMRGAFTLLHDCVNLAGAVRAQRAGSYPSASAEIGKE